MPTYRCASSMVVALLIALAGCGQAEKATPVATNPSGSPSLDPQKVADFTNAPAPSAPSTSPTEPSTTPHPSTHKPEFTVSAQQLAKDYVTSAEAAMEKYKDKVAQIDGKVLKVKTSDSGVKVLQLVGEGDMHVECGIASDFAPAADALKEGQSVSVVGTIYGPLGGVVSVDYGEIIK